jgi:hypothetical protein
VCVLTRGSARCDSKISRVMTHEPRTGSGYASRDRSSFMLNPSSQCMLRMIPGMAAVVDQTSCLSRGEHSRHQSQSGSETGHGLVLSVAARVVSHELQWYDTLWLYVSLFTTSRNECGCHNVVATCYGWFEVRGRHCQQACKLDRHDSLTLSKDYKECIPGG